MWKQTLLSLGTGMLLAGLTPMRAQADAAVPAGQKIFLQNKCTQCHAISALKIAKVKSDESTADVDEDEALLGKKIEPPDLSDVGKKKEKDWIVKWLKKEVKLDGHKHKKKFKGSDEELDTLATWVASLKYDVANSTTK